MSVLSDERRRDLITGAIGTWLVVALVSDGWAHLNVPELESFFTPWHGALYAGFAAMAGWIALLAWRSRGAGSSVLGGLPRGYRGAAAGVLVFGVGGVADLVWHEIFGIEVAVDALVSPSHLVLGVGGLLMLSGPLRASGVLSEDRLWPATAVLSLVLSTSLVAFFLQYTSPFPMPAVVESFIPTPEGTPGHIEAEMVVIAGLSGYLVTTVLFTLPLLLILRSRERFAAPVTVLIGPIAWLPVAVVGFPWVPVAGAVGATAGAIVADLLLARVRFALPIVAGGVPVLVWSGQLAGLAMADALRWPVSLWAGAVVLAGFAGAAVGLLASVGVSSANRSAASARTSLRTR
ncbi:hypothetical protein [Lentzea albidocapillata]|uniref:Uncharacterized protein n=1 Tax=Lentzea albidocapillata TaxID=40571 RepID=A0A1W2FUC8_9PSEU|nr:hypothetical protein [Lentzea albidocapillata]SMD25559.1 hypothetical protein SAMN05660733_08198 [Lentzea albidocapillata]